MSFTRCDICGQPWLSHATDCPNLSRSSDLPSDLKHAHRPFSASSYEELRGERDDLRHALAAAQRVIEAQAKALEATWAWIDHDLAAAGSSWKYAEAQRLTAEAERAREGK